MKYKHWFFDLDGTLARTGEDIVVAWKGALQAMGRDLTNFDKVFKIGPTLEKIVYELYDCRNAAAKASEAQYDHEKQIAGNIQSRRNHKEQQRRIRVSERTHRVREEIIDEGKDKTGQDNPQIYDRLIHDGRLRLNQPQQLRGEKDAYGSKTNRKDEAADHRG